MKAKTPAILAVLCASAIGVVALFLAAVLVRGLVISVLWGWFVVPVFGLPALHVAPALGLAVLLNYLLNHKKGAASLMDIFLGALAALGVGWVIQLFV